MAGRFTPNRVWSYYTKVLVFSPSALTVNSPEYMYKLLSFPGTTKTPESIWCTGLVSSTRYPVTIKYGIYSPFQPRGAPLPPHSPHALFLGVSYQTVRVITVSHPPVYGPPPPPPTARFRVAEPPSSNTIRSTGNQTPCSSQANYDSATRCSPSNKIQSA